LLLCAAVATMFVRVSTSGETAAPRMSDGH
jgi:hypothetical protein